MIDEDKNIQTVTLTKAEVDDHNDESQVEDETETIENNITFTDSDINKYFSLCNRPCKGIISEQKSLAKFLGSSWNELDYTRTDALFDLLFVDDDARQKENPDPFSNSSNEKKIQESFPRLYLNSGQKINVDFENDLWTWRDEHSGPFSWMSRSQQDLTLLDLEPENISKPQPKTLRVDLENPDSVKDAEDPFIYPANCWSKDIIDSYKKSEKNIILSPCTSIEAIEVMGCQSETDVDTVECGNNLMNISQTHQQVTADTDATLSGDNVATDISHVRKDSGKEKRRRSPSPKKMLRSNSSLRKSPSKCLDQGEQHLISKNKDDSYEEKNSFSNPLVETEWSSFVGEDESNEEIKNLTKTLPNVPARQIIDRGSDIGKSSPYQVQNDNVHLISPGESPPLASHTSRLYTVTNDLSGWSTESTPDHNTHLLKGMQNDSIKNTGLSHQQFSPAVLDKYETDEVLTIENEGDDFKITTDSEIKRESNIPSTGFDFLDNW